ncbi:LTA synthase family protein [Vagococcus sp. JNUCC 83]
MQKRLEDHKKKSWFKRLITHPLTKILFTLIIVYVSNFYLQLSQNTWDFSLAWKFSTQWHVEKFLLGTLVLLFLDMFLISLSGSFLVGNSTYMISIGLLGVANSQKMLLRMEPIYPDDLKMIFEFTMMKDIIGTTYFILAIVIIIIALLGFLYALYRSLRLSKKQQIIRLICFVVSLAGLLYASQFNNPNNLLRKEFNKTALWIPYSQKMNYYNTGFMGGFLYNLNVEAMDEPKGYSKEAVEKIVTKYNKLAKENNAKKQAKDKPNVVFIMSESFSDPDKLDGIKLNKSPITNFREVARNSVYSGEMLSQNYGGGTANIEFEALTGISMALLNPQMTTPYTMMLPKKTEFPSIVSSLEQQNYQTVAIHPYNTSMYKRKDVYNVLGFNKFLDENTMTHKDKLSDNGYISDSSAFNEVLDIIKESDKSSFVHLVTMQTHMPYNNKYTTSPYTLTTSTSNASIDNYALDISYTSDALKQFITEINELDQQTIVVFWGDHLPSIYPDDIVEKNNPFTTHLTEYLIYDTLSKGVHKEEIMSPFYFSSLITKFSSVEQTGFNVLLLELQKMLPAFEKQMYYVNGKWEKEVSFTKEERELYEAYQMIVYDLVSGEKYGQKMFDIQS